MLLMYSQIFIILFYYSSKKPRLLLTALKGQNIIFKELNFLKAINYDIKESRFLSNSSFFLIKVLLFLRFFNQELLSRKLLII